MTSSLSKNFVETLQKVFDDYKIQNPDFDDGGKYCFICNGIFNNGPLWKAAKDDGYQGQEDDLLKATAEKFCPEVGVPLKLIPKQTRTIISPKPEGLNPKLGLVFSRWEHEIEEGK